MLPRSAHTRCLARERASGARQSRRLPCKKTAYRLRHPEKWAVSSAGRALLSHGRGHWFEPSTAHHAKAPAKQTSRKSQERLLFPEWLLFEHFGTVLGQCQWRAG